MKMIWLILLLAMTSCKTEKQEMPAFQPLLPVLAAQATLQDVPEYISITGELRSSAGVDVHAQVEGKVLKVLVQEGQWVEEGTPLIVIDPKPYKLKVEEARCELAKLTATLNEAQKTLDRFHSLAKKELISKREWDELEAKVSIAKAELALGQAKLKTSKLDLLHCQIKSPLKGRIGKLDLFPGQLVKETPLCHVATLDPLVCEYKLSEKQFHRLSKDTVQLDISPLSAPQVLLKAKTTFVDNHFDPKTGQILLRARVNNANYQVRPGQIVRVKIPISVNRQATVVLQRAVRYNHQGPFVYVIQQDQTVVERTLKLGSEHGDTVVVLDGLSSSELIVTEGHQRLFNRAKVEIKS